MLLNSASFTSSLRILYNEFDYVHLYFCFRKVILINVILKMISMSISKEKLSQLFYLKELEN